MSNFYTLLTRTGAALHANAQVQQTTVPWTHMRLGDGNGAPVTPTETQTGLVRQVHVLPITDIAVHPDNPNWVIAEAVVPSDVGGWTVRETAIYGGADGNTCIAVGNYPETYKPVLAEGAGREMVMRMVVQISSVATVKLQIDPAVAIASRAWVESLVATPAKAGLVKFASLAEHLAGEAANKAATPGGVKAMLDRVRGMPLFFRDVHFGDRASLIRVFGGMATPNDAIQISALTHPELVKAVLRGDVATCDEAAFQADPYQRGKWSRGTAYLDDMGKPQGWVRTPDLNQAMPDSLPPPFVRGGADAKAGSIGKDTMRKLQGSLSNSTGAITWTGNLSASGVFKIGSEQGPQVSVTTSGTGHRNVLFDSEAGLPAGHTGTEFAPWHIYGVSYSITSNGVFNEGAIDTEQVMGEVLQVKARTAALEDSHGLLKITGNANLTGVDNKLVMGGIVQDLKLEKGDVVRIKVTAIAYNKLHTVESIADSGQIVLNYEHCAIRGNGTLKLPDYGGPVTIERIAKWHSASYGLGQDWVDLTALLVNGVNQQNSSGRTVGISIFSGNNIELSVSASMHLVIDGKIVTGWDLMKTNTPSDSNLFSVLPNGCTYKYQSSGYPNGTYSVWQLR